MKILMVAPADLSSAGGMSSQLLGVSRSLASTGHDLSLVAYSGNREDRVYQTKFRGFGRFRLFQASCVQSFSSLLITLLKSVDILHVRGIYNAFLLSRLNFCRARTVYEVPCLAIYENRFSSLKRRGMYYVEKSAVRNCDSVRVHTSFSKKILDELSPMHTAVIPPGIEVPSSITPDNERSSITFIGGLFWWQNVENLLYAAQHIAREGENIRINIIGDGPEEQRLVGLAEQLGLTQDVIFHGKLPRDTALSILDNSRICVITKSRHMQANMSVPTKMLEGMAHGIPIVANRIAGVEEIAQKSVFYVDTEDGQSFGKALIKLYHDRDRQRKLAEKGRALAANHSFDILAGRLVEYYAET